MPTLIGERSTEQGLCNGLEVLEAAGTSTSINISIGSMGEWVVGGDRGATGQEASGCDIGRWVHARSL